jgi:DNA-binding CsgD family transcriptional regulator
MSRETLESTILWQAFCRPLGLEHDISINFHRSPEFFYTISSSRDTQPYSREERLLLNWLQPHLKQRFTHLLAAEPNHPLGRPAVNGAEVPSLVCEADGHVLSISSQAQRLLGACGIRFGRRLPIVWRDWLTEQIRPAITKPAMALDLARPGGSLRVHCLRNRHSGQHRLILEWMPRIGTALTNREKEVAGWMAQGKTNREISSILGISSATVKVHVERILQKLDVENRTAAARVLTSDSQK